MYPFWPNSRDPFHLSPGLLPITQPFGIFLRGGWLVGSAFLFRQFSSVQNSDLVSNFNISVWKFHSQNHKNPVKSFREFCLHTHSSFTLRLAERVSCAYLTFLNKNPKPLFDPILNVLLVFVSHLLMTGLCSRCCFEPYSYSSTHVIGFVASYALWKTPQMNSIDPVHV